MTVLGKLKEFEINKDQTKEDIQMNKHNSNTSVYYLLLKRYIRKGNVTVGDLCSKEYTDYLNNSISLLVNNAELNKKILKEKNFQ